MNINGHVTSALKTVGVPVSFMTYSGEAKTYITFFEYNQQGESYSDDEEDSTGHFIQVDIWSRCDYTNVVNLAKQAMIAAGFLRITEADLYENETKIYHKGLRFYYIEEV